MIIKFSKIISCSSEHPQYLASNLLEYPSTSSWCCANSNELIASVVFQLAESSVITGLEVGNYQSCIIVVEASTSKEPDNWLPIVNHQFLTHDEAANNKFKDQVQLFSKRNLNFDIINKRFDRVKVTCMQPANPRVLFGLKFIYCKSEVIVDLNLDVFGRFKLKHEDNDKVEELKETKLKLFHNKKVNQDELREMINKSGLSKFRNKLDTKNTFDNNLILGKSSVGTRSCSSIAGPFTTSNSLFSNDFLLSNNNHSILSTRTLFGDFVSTCDQKFTNISPKKTCNDFCGLKNDELCNTCYLLSVPRQRSKNRIGVKKTIQFSKLLKDVVFSLSGYVNPQRDEIRRKLLLMGGKYNVNPNITNNKCTHLICAFQNTPKSRKLIGHTKIVNHQYIEDCFNLKKRLPWRRYALDSRERNHPESEEEVEGSEFPVTQPSIYNQETDDSDSC
ncbi:DNA repair protein XRCC1 [Copidosoma floridanum]|uniref:DNA repair protein XRCC1 n=1 Tax=Copidosoma floridanum TaxID=29053 RepID=UPI0006C98805|nr:DNA repair protein XRCC1 [Copidosoma floridanum]